MQAALNFSSLWIIYLIHFGNQGWLRTIILMFQLFSFNITEHRNAKDFFNFSKNKYEKKITQLFFEVKTLTILKLLLLHLNLVAETFSHISFSHLLRLCYQRYFNLKKEKIF